jgi:ribosomal protein L37AE/L43A
LNNDDQLDYSGLESYQEIIEEVISGRTEGHHCPHCHEGILICEMDGVKIFLKCEQCGKFFEGYLA